MLEHTPLGEGKVWNGDPDTLSSLLGVERTGAFAKLCEVKSLNAPQATQLLWDTYSPQYAVWIPFAAIGVFAVIALIIFSQRAKRWSDMNA
jgi:hypothetical protein